jgi:hypothetical protein
MTGLHLGAYGLASGLHCFLSPSCFIDSPELLIEKTRFRHSLSCEQFEIKFDSRGSFVAAQTR